MIHLKPVITVLTMLLLVNACDDVIDSTSVDFSEIFVAAHSLTDAGLDGSYTTGCYVGGGGSVYEDLRIRGNTWNYAISDYTSGDCTLSPTEGTLSGTVQVGTDILITGWVDSAGLPVTTPPFTADPADGSATLSPNQAVSPLFLTI
jgi:hypothetical protein